MLADKAVIVTGAGHGIGETVAVELGKQGASVVVNDLGSDVDGSGASEEPARETAAAVREAGGAAIAHFGDVASLEYTEELVETAVSEFGRVDGAVNFAGILRDSISYKMTGEEWDQVIRVHLRGHFSLLRNVAAHWREVAREEGGALDSQRSFVAVSSRAAMGNVGQANYSAAKAGVLGLMRATARELNRYNVRVNALVPTAYTRMIDEIPEEQRSFTREEMPPEKIGPVVGYLMSDAADDITGCSIRAAGDQVGLISDPAVYRVGIKDGGWSVADLADAFESTVAEGETLDNSAPSH